MTPKLPSYMGGLLAVVLLATSVPAHALRQPEPAQSTSEAEIRAGLEESSAEWVAKRLVWLQRGDNPERETAAWDLSDQLSGQGRTSAKQTAMFQQAPALVKALSDNLKAVRETRKFYFWDALAHMAARGPFHDALETNLDDLIERGFQNATEADASDLRHAAEQFLKNLARFKRFRSALKLHQADLKAMANGRLSSASGNSNALTAGLEETLTPATYEEIEAMRQEETLTPATYEEIEAMRQEELDQPGVREAVQQWQSRQLNPDQILPSSVFDFAKQQGIHADVVHLWLSQNGYDGAIDRKRPVWRRDSLPTGLEEIQIKTIADLLEMGDANAVELAERLRANEKAGITLLPKDLVDREKVERQEREVELYAHLAVAAETLTLLPLEWNFKGRLYELDTDPTVANQQLETANAASAAGRAVIVGLAEGQEIGALHLLDIRGVKVRLKPGTMPQLNSQLQQIHAFLRRPEALKNVILDLTSGTVRTEKIQGREYYALDIAA